MKKNTKITKVFDNIVQILILEKENIPPKQVYTEKIDLCCSEEDPFGLYDHLKNKMELFCDEKDI